MVKKRDANRVVPVVGTQQKGTLTSTREIFEIIKNGLIIILLIILIVGAISLFTSLKSGDLFQESPFAEKDPTIREEGAPLTVEEEKILQVSLQNTLNEMELTFEEGNTNRALKLAEQVGDVARQANLPEADITRVVADLKEAIQNNDRETFNRIVADIEVE